MKKIITMLAVLLVTTLISVSLSYATIRSPRILTDLSFSGTDALCTLSVTESGKEIGCQVELLKGNILVKSWQKSNLSKVVMYIQIERWKIK